MKITTAYSLPMNAVRRKLPRKPKCVDYLVHVMPKLHKKLSGIGISPLNECTNHGLIGIDVAKFRPKTDDERLLRECLIAFALSTGTDIKISRHLCEKAHCYYVLSIALSESQRSYYLCMENEFGSVVTQITMSASEY